MKVSVITTSRADWNGLGMVALSLRKRGATVMVHAAYGHKALTAIDDDNFDFVMYGQGAGSRDGRNDNRLITRAAIGMTDLALQLDQFEPAMALVVGDRHEMLTAAFVVAMKAIPLAHIAGGDISGGSLDENWRHAISKIANIHFPTTDMAADRLRRMGEAPEDIYMLGSPSVDRMAATELPTRAEAMDAIGIGRGVGQFILVNWQSEHPSNGNLDMLLKVLRRQDKPVIYIGPNPEFDAPELAHMGRLNVAEMTRAVYRESLPPPLYLAALKHCTVLVGNSSSGFYEAPYYGTPVVNVGRRQAGRAPKPDCMRTVAHVTEGALEKAISDAFHGGRWPIEQPFGRGNSADRIAQTIMSYCSRRPAPMRKHFHD